MKTELTLPEMRERLEELLGDLHRLETIPSLQRIGNVGVRIGTGEQWVIDLALEALARREREAESGVGLLVEVVVNRIVISLPFESLQTAVECFSDFEKWNDDKQKVDRPKVTDVQLFAREVLHALLDEGEDGSTRVTRMFDDAFRHAVEYGAEGIRLPDDDDYESPVTDGEAGYNAKTT